MMFVASQATRARDKHGVGFTCLSWNTGSQYERHDSVADCYLVRRRRRVVLFVRHGAAKERISAALQDDSSGPPPAFMSPKDKQRGMASVKPAIHASVEVEVELEDKREYCGNQSAANDINSQCNVPPPGLNVDVLGLRFNIPPQYLLLCVPALWGSFSPALRALYNMEHGGPDPQLFNASRLTVSVIAVLPFFLMELKAFLTTREQKKSAAEGDEDRNGDQWLWLRGGAELGFYVLLASQTQINGLQTTSAGRAAFLNQLQTVMVPMISSATGIESLDFVAVVSALIAVAGVALLSLDKPASATSDASEVSSPAFALSEGDVWEIVSALFFSLYVVRLSAFSTRCKPALLIGTKVIFQFLTSWALLLTTHWNRLPQFFEYGASLSQTEALLTAGAVIWTGLFVNAISGVVQTIGQRGVQPSSAALVLSTQPLWAAGLASALLGERLGIYSIGGAALILAGTMLSSVASKK